MSLGIAELTWFGAGDSGQSGVKKSAAAEMAFGFVGLKVVREQFTARDSGERELQFGGVVIIGHGER